MDTLYTGDARLADIVFRHPDIIALINRFDIYLGLGDATIKEICISHGIDYIFFTAIINTFIYEDYFPDRTLKSESVGTLLDYLTKTDLYYRDFQLPNIERHFNPFIAKSDSGNSNLSLLRHFFMEMQMEFQQRIKKDLEEWFPLFRKGDFNNVAKEAMIMIDDNILDKIRDLGSFFVLHLKGEYDRNLCVAVVSSIFALEKHVKQDNRIRQRILLPLIKED